MSKTKQQLWTKFGGKEFFARMADNATHDGNGNEISTTYATKDTVVGATSQAAGEAGLVPAPAIADKDKFLKGDGTWDEPPRVSLDDYYYDVYGNGLSATRHNTSLGVSATLLGTSGNVNSTNLSAQFSLSWGGSVINMINVDSTWPNGSYWAFGSGSNKGARYMLPPPSSGSVKYAVNKADGGIYWDTIPTATASGTGVTGNDGLMSAADKAKVDSFREVSDSEIDDIFIDGIWVGGRKYPIVQIGNQLWTTKNLDWKFDGLTVDGEYGVTTPAAWYPNKDESTYGWEGAGYGLLYNAYAAQYMNNNNLLPNGWRAPTQTDWSTLIATVSTTGAGSFTNNAGLKLKAVSVGGTDDYGFSMLLPGIVQGNGSWVGIGTYVGNSATYTNTVGNIEVSYVNSNSTVNYLAGAPGDPTDGYSIRLVKDIT
jgi:uncharacterized protein (TIGR02145 family)